MAWIESHQELGRHPKVKKLARLLADVLPTSIGRLHLVWWWALDFAENGDLSKYDAQEIADAAMWEGDAEEFLQALIEAEWVDKTETGVALHDWADRKRDRNEVRKQWESMSRRTRPFLLERDGWRCVYCGSRRNLEADHIVPICRGGNNDVSNLQTLCRSCNRSKGAL